MSAFSNISWDPVFQVDDVKNAYSSFVSNSQAVLKDITTKKISRAKIKLEKCPWFTDKLEARIKVFYDIYLLSQFCLPYDTRMELILCRLSRLALQLF